MHFTNLLLSFLLGRHDQLDRVTSASIGRKTPGRKEILANLMAMTREDDKAARALAEIVKENPQNHGAVRSLAFIVGHGNPSGMSQMFVSIRKEWLQTNPCNSQQSSDFFFLGLELLLKIDREAALKALNGRFFPAKLSTLRKESTGMPIVLWHIPKTGGTSLNASLNSFFYTPESPKLPDFKWPNSLREILTTKDFGGLPFLSTGHLEGVNLGDIGTSQHVSLAVRRDPASRLISLYKQYVKGLAGRLAVSPQHGHVYPFFPVAPFKAWLENRAPDSLVNAYSASMGNLPQDYLRQTNWLDFDHLAAGASKFNNKNGISAPILVDEAPIRNASGHLPQLGSRELRLAIRVTENDKKFLEKFYSKI